MRLRSCHTVLGALCLGSLSLGCGPDMGPDVDLGAPAGALATQEAEAVSTSGITSHFSQWLSANGYGTYDFARKDLSGGSYGGKSSASDTVVNQPVIFIHGNSDKAIGTGTAGQTGWNASIEYFQSRGYKTSELYAMTWGPANALLSAQQYHSKTHVMRVRKFIEAVKAYTGASKVDIITHSMGVTLARKAILGGTATDALEGGQYNVGSPLTDSVDTFVGIAGANLGLTNCYTAGATTPTCGATNGLFPGSWAGAGPSNYLKNLQSSRGYEGAYRYALYSTADEVVGYGGIVYGEYTSRIPGQTGEKVYTGYPYGHFNSKDLTGEVQYNMVKSHLIP
ncbi:lipase family protein [Stigmatella aurantiaca]|uniref:Lipase n=1 Tax=Stigmatella aurantiaca (strain DW4/3-1) TaxID=378806 RepID=Q098G8_STIAD|nr:lipase family protein [Stigmatella aurantiaca]ADO68093.1 Lipase [Stigmatella aurantiaca DW4/3-1]EAU68108.1 lipase superfamily [Stigmatella aurantiaca DW4/3-1]